MGGDCFSGSEAEGGVMGSEGSALGRMGMGTGWVVVSSMLVGLGLVDFVWGAVCEGERLLRLMCCMQSGLR